MCVSMILWLSEVYVYVKHTSVWNRMNESMIIFMTQYYENDDYVKVVLTCKKHTLIDWMKLTCTQTQFSWMNDVNEWEWGIVGWTLIVSRDEVSRPSLFSL